MAEFLSDEEVFGTAPAATAPGQGSTNILSDEEVFANLTPPAVTKQDVSFAGMTAGKPPNTPLRVLRDPRFRAAVAAFAAPEILVRAIPELAPAAAASTAGWLARLGLSGGVGGGAYEAFLKAPEVMAGTTTGTEATQDVVGSMLLGSGFGIGGGVLGQKLLQTAGTAIGRAVTRKPTSVLDVGRNLKAGAAEGFVRPLFESTTAAESRAASELIENATGIKPAQSIGEVLGKRMFGGTYADLEKELGAQATGALTPDARDKISKAVLFTATDLLGKGAPPGQVADQTITALQKELKYEISGPAREAAKQFAQELDTAMKAAASKTVSEGASIATPATAATPYTAGNVGKEAERQSVEDFRNMENQLFGAYRASLGNNPAKATLSNTAAKAKEILNTGLETTVPGEETASPFLDQFGRKVITTGEPTKKTIATTVPDAQARKFLSELSEASGTEQDIEKLRQYRSQIGASIDDPNALGNIPNANKKQLYGAVSKDLEEAIDKLPDSSVKTALQKANAFRRDNIDKFNLTLMEKAGTPVEEGGTTGQSLFKSVLGDTDRYKLFQNVLGPRFAAFRESARDAILNESRQGGNFSIKSTLDAIKDLPTEVQQDLFPQAQRLRQLAEKEIKIANLNGSTPKNADDVLNWMQANEAEVKGFLSPGGEQKFLDALHVRSTEQRRLNNAILADVAQGKSDAIARDPVGFINSILTGAYSKPGAVKEALDVVAKHSPKTREDLQVAYLERLLKSSTVDGIISGEEIAKRIAIPTSGRVASSGGKELEIAEDILGRSKVDNLRGLATALGTTQKALLGRQIQTEATVLDLLTAGKTPTEAVTIMSIKAGIPIRSMQLISGLLNKPAQWRYQIAARLMNDPSKLAMVSKPIKALKGAEAADLMNALGQYVTTSTPLREVAQPPVEQPAQGP